MAVAYVQTFPLAATGSLTSTGVQTGTTGTVPTVGNYAIAWMWGWSSTTQSGPSFSDTSGNAWNVVGFQVRGADCWCCLGWAKLASVGASYKVTGKASVTGGDLTIVAAEFTGIASTSPVDGTAVGTTGSSTAPAPGSLTVTARDLVCAVMVDDIGGNPASWTSPSSPWVSVAKETNGASFECGEAMYAINPSSPTNPAWTVATNQWAASQFALLAAATAAGGLPWGPLISIPVLDPDSDWQE